MCSGCLWTAVNKTIIFLGDSPCANVTEQCQRTDKQKPRYDSFTSLSSLSSLSSFSFVFTVVVRLFFGAVRVFLAESALHWMLWRFEHLPEPVRLNGGGGGGVGGGEVQLYKYEHEKYNGNHFTHKWIKATRTRSAKCRMQNAARKMKNGKGGKGMKGGGRVVVRPHAWSGLVYCFSTMYRIV